jgi:hypothetical protein
MSDGLAESITEGERLGGIPVLGRVVGPSLGSKGEKYDRGTWKLTEG